MKLLLKALKAFVLFWWDFLVGDTPEIFLAVVLFLCALDLLIKHGLHRYGAVVALPLLVIATLSITLVRAVRKSRRG